MQLLRPRNEISIMHSQQKPLNLDYIMSCVASTDTFVFAGERSVRRLQNNGLIKRHNVSDIHSADWHGHARCATLRDKAVLEFMQQNDASAVAQHVSLTNHSSTQQQHTQQHSAQQQQQHSQHLQQQQASAARAAAALRAREAAAARAQLQTAVHTLQTQHNQELQQQQQ
jgi:hypothetical protein